VVPTWIAIFRAIKSSHIPVSNVIGAAYRVVFSSRETRTISCSLRGATRRGAPQRGAARRVVARRVAGRFIIIEYYGVIDDLAWRASLRECQGNQPNQVQYYNYRVK